MGTRMLVCLLCLLGLSLGVQAATLTIVDLPDGGTDGAIDINTDKTYTHTFDFGTGVLATINGVPFEQGPSANVGAAQTAVSLWGYGYTIESTASGVTVAVHAGNDNIDADGNAEDLLRDMIYHSGGPVGEGSVLTLSGLTPGTIYSTRWYYRAYSTGADRTITFSADGESNSIFSDTIDINIDAGGAHYLDYTFTADDTDVTIRFITHNDNMSAHIYGLSNEVIGLPVGATTPAPADATDDIPRDAPLSWAAGALAHTHDVYLGTVFEDVNDASRADPRGVLVGQDHTATSYAPAEPLAYAQTYYWRIDEVNAPPDNTIYKGQVWSFTTEPFAYPVADVIASSNGVSDEGVGPERTVDGSGLNDADQHSTGSGDMWLAMAGDDPLYVQYEFDRVYKLHQMLVWNYNVQFETLLGFGLKDVAVAYSEDGADWTALADVQLNQATGAATYTANTTIDFQGVSARYVRLTADSTWGGSNQGGLSEVRFTYVPVRAREPQPASGTPNVAPEVTLSWRPGREAAVHEVLLSTDAQTVIDGTAPGTTVSEAALETGMLNLDQTYYWRVDEANDAETPTLWQGDVWDFTTQAYLVVEDFERYNDLDDLIYETWIDGWVNGSGSTVGYLEAPFAEQQIVRSGRQSMPLEYDNSTVDYSEATVDIADLQAEQDWSKYGIQALTLYFHGDPDNAAQRMYVKLNGSKIVYEGQVDVLTQALWQPWNIDLAASGVNLSHVTELSIGVERLGGTGGTGRAYFDDIRLYPAMATGGTFSIQPWTNDQDSGISADKTYTHTGKSSGEGVDGEPILAGNGVYFERDLDRSGTNWTLTGPATNVFDTSNPVNVTGDGAALARGFFYGDQDNNHPVLTLTGLEPGTTYVTTFYTVGYGGVGARFVDVTPGDNPRHPTRLDQNGADSGNGQLIRYTYIATGTEMSFAFDALSTGDSWHHYAFSNEVADAN